MSNVDTLLDQTKLALMRRKGSVFITSILFSMKFHWSESVKTVQTNGLELTVNPNYFTGLNLEERSTLLAHEAWHVALGHTLPSRRGIRDAKQWNEAGDQVINNMLAEQGFRFPPDVHYDTRFKNQSTEEVFDVIYKEGQQKNNSRNQNQNNPFGNDVVDTPPEGEGHTSSFSNEDKIRQTICKASLANEQSKSKGQLPAELERLLDDLLNPKLDWTSLLQRFVNDFVNSDFTWTRPNKRFMPEFYLPGNKSDSIRNLTVAIDTSGSVSESDLNAMLSEIQYIFDTVNPVELTLIDCDTRINHIYNCDSNTEIQSLKFTGGGGTSFKPVIEYCKKHSPVALIYFTDLWATQITEDPGFPILWVCYDSYHEPAPIGETIYYQPKTHD